MYHNPEPLNASDISSWNPKSHIGTLFWIASSACCNKILVWIYAFCAFLFQFFLVISTFVHFLYRVYMVYGYIFSCMERSTIYASVKFPIYWFIMCKVFFSICRWTLTKWIVYWICKSACFTDFIYKPLYAVDFEFRELPCIYNVILIF